MPLTKHCPKQMVLVNQEPLIKHVLAPLPQQITNLCVVYGSHFGEQIRDYLGDSYGGRAVEYRYQAKAEGTGQALMLADDFVDADESVLIIFADDITERSDLEKAIKHKWAMLGHAVQSTEPFGVLVYTPGYKLVDLVEKPKTKEAPSKLASTGIMVVHKDFFQHPTTERVGDNHEYRHVEMIKKCLVAGIEIDVVYQRTWESVAQPSDIRKVEAYLNAKKAR